MSALSPPRSPKIPLSASAPEVISYDGPRRSRRFRPARVDRDKGAPGLKGERDEDKPKSSPTCGFDLRLSLFDLQPCCLLACCLLPFFFDLLSSIFSLRKRCHYVSFAKNEFAKRTHSKAALYQTKAKHRGGMHRSSKARNHVNLGSLRGSGTATSVTQSPPGTA